VVGAIDIGIRLRLTLLQRQQRVKQTVGMAFYTINWLRSSLLHELTRELELPGHVCNGRFLLLFSWTIVQVILGPIVQVVLFQSRGSRQSVA
jgi:hypothetical protein